MKINKTGGAGGAWLKKDDIKSGEPLKIVSEAAMIEGQNGSQLVAKVRQKGGADSLNVAINNTSRNALIEAFGDDTTNWVNKIVTAVTEKAIIAGKRSTILYLVPEGYSIVDGADGFVTIQADAVEIDPEPAPKTRRAPLPVEDTADEDTREAPLPSEDGY